VASGIVAIPGEPHDDAERRERRALGEVQPLEVGGAFGRAHRRSQPAVAVALQDVLDDGPRLAHDDVAVDERGQLAERGLLHEELRRRG
jgi:hypothetical protein